MAHLSQRNAKQEQNEGLDSTNETRQMARQTVWVVANQWLIIALIRIIFELFQSNGNLGGRKNVNQSEAACDWHTTRLLIKNPAIIWNETL